MALTPHRYLPVLLAYCAGSLLSVVACLTVWHWEQEQQKTQFHNSADQLAASLQQNIDSNLEILQATGEFYHSSERVERHEFKAFVTGFLERYPSISSINWVRRVSATDRQAFEKAVRAEGYPNFQIIERGNNGQMVSARDRPEYFSISYLEPIQEWHKALGFDVGSEPVRREALERSRDTGKMTTSGRIDLVGTNQLGFVTFQPIYSNHVDNTKLRRENLQGFVTGVFEIADIVQSSLSDLNLNNIDFYLFDESAVGKERFLSFYSSTKELKSETYGAEQSARLEKSLKIDTSFCQNSIDCTRILKVADRKWSLLVVPAGYTSIQTHWGAWTVLAIGLLLTTILAIYLVMSLRHTACVEELVQERTAQTRKLEKALEDLKNTQAQLIQTEKMSSLGQLVAGVAHEINNPVNFIYGNLTYANNYADDLLELIQLYRQHSQAAAPEIQEHIESIELEFLTEDLPKLMSSMKLGAERIREIVLSLRNFSRYDEAEMKPIDIHEGIDSTLLILQNRLKASPDHSGITVVKEYGKLPLIECYAGQLNQVFMNIIANAIDALESSTNDSPQIRIRTEMLNPYYLTVRIADNGSGMTEDVKGRLFDPFFTTKPVGKGTGLGLSISYQIVVEKHGGTIKCESAPGRGTEFWIDIPVQQSDRLSAFTATSALKQSKSVLSQSLSGIYPELPPP